MNLFESGNSFSSPVLPAAVLATVAHEGVMTEVIIMGSGPNAPDVQNWAKLPDQIFVAINNAWRLRGDWDVLIHPEDFPADRRPPVLGPNQQIVGAEDYVPLQNLLGGFVLAGGTMAFTAAYWALLALRPSVIAMIGCDMVYPAAGPTHFYGAGTADPLREDISLRSLEAKSARFMLLAARAGCAVVNLSQARESRLLYPRMRFVDLTQALPQRVDNAFVDAILAEEDALDYNVPSGRYWLEQGRFDPVQIDRIDALWREAAVRSALLSETGLSDRPQVLRQNG
jgi:hypothetical protein